MSFRRGEEEEGDDEDEATQLVIQQSLKDWNQRATEPGATEPDGRRADAAAGSSWIFSAVRRGDEQLLKKLSSRGELFLQTDDRGWTPLHQAAAQKNQAVLELVFTASGPDSVRSRTRAGGTALHLAVELGLMENASFLLEHGSEPDAQDEQEEPPLLLALRSGRSDLVDLLLHWGSCVNQVSLHGRRPLHEACRLGSAALAGRLLEAGARPDPRSHYGLTPLALAAQGGHVQVMEMLLSRGADVLAQAQDEASVLYEASASGSAAAVALLLRHGADANVAKTSGYLPLHRAAHRGHLEMLKLLIPVTSRAEVDDSGMSPLHSAADGGQTHCIKALLDAGFDPNFMLPPWIRRSFDDERRSALFFAVANDDVASARLLLEGGAMPNQDPIKCLQVALRQGNYQLINLLLRHGSNVNYYCKVNTTHFPSALQYALKDEVILRMLCQYGYDVDRCFDCPYGNKPHVPDDYEGWTDSVIKDTLFCEVITVRWLKHLSGHLVRVLLDYMDHVTICSKLRAALTEQQQWKDICYIQENARSLQHLCRLAVRRCLGRRRLRSPVFISFLPLPHRLRDFVLYRELGLYLDQDQDWDHTPG